MKLPIIYNISWYEQKAVIVLLALLYLGVKNIHLGPTLPAFLSPNVAKVLVDNFGIAGIGSVEKDLKTLWIIRVTRACLKNALVILGAKQTKTICLPPFSPQILLPLI